MLYDCVARENPSDRRLVALAQVRQMSVVRDDDGTITALPHAERAVESCLESIRRERVARGRAGAKLDMNHVWVHVWPVVDLDLDALGALGVQDQPADRRRRGRGGRRPGPPRRTRRRRCPDGRALQRPPRSRGDHVRRGAADRAAAAARRLRLQGGALAPARTGLPLRAQRGARRSRRLARRARPRRHRPARAGRPSLRPEQVRHPRRRGDHPDDPAPRGRHPGRPVRRPDEVARLGRGAGVPARDRRPRPRRGDAGAGGVVRALRGCAHLDGLRHREHGLGGQGAAPDRGVHPGRRRDQRRGGRHQRRRPALLERRGHDADAHQGHPGDDPGERDGAHRQAVAGLLRRRLGRGQLRHRRLRPGDGAQRAGAVLGARPRRRVRRADGALRAHLRRAGGDRAPSYGLRRPGRPRHLLLPARRGGQRLPPPSARSSRPRRTPTARRPSTSAR